MASRFWVGGTGTWDASTTTNWSATTGGAGGASVPTSADDVFFDANSGVGTVTATITLAILTLDCTNYSGTLIHQSLPLTLTGTRYKLSATMTYTPTTINFSPSFGVTQLVTTAGKTLSGFTAGGSGTIQLQDAVQCATFTQNSGTFDTQSFNMNCTGFTSSNSSTRVLTFGSSQITCSGAWNCGTTTNLTVNAGTSTINLTGTSTNFNWGSGFTFNNLVGSGASTLTITGAHTFNNFTRTGTTAKTDALAFSANVTITGTFTVNGNSTTNRVLVQSGTIGTARTITAATVSVSNADFMDITGAGAGSWNLAAITGLSGDALGNTNITFTTPATQYRVGASSSATLWSDSTKWASSSGGSGGTGRVPLPQDDVIIDNNSTAANVNAVIDMPRAGRTIDSTGYNIVGSFSPMVTNASGGIATTIYGSWLQTKVFNASVSSAVTFAGRSALSLQFQNTMNSVTVAAPSGTYTLLTNFTSSNNFSLNNGTFDASGFAVTIATFLSTATTTRVLSMGGGTWSLSSTSATNIWSATASALTLNNNGSPIVISTTSANTRTFAGGGQTYGALTYIVAGSTGTLVITGANTFSAINFSDVTNARTLQFTAATTTTISTAAGWNVNGTAGKLMSVQSVTAATHTISIASGTVSSDYLSLTNSIATGGATFYAGANSTNVSGNTGWIFTAPPSGNTSAFFSFF